MLKLFTVRVSDRPIDPEDPARTVLVLAEDRDRALALVQAHKKASGYTIFEVVHETDIADLGGAKVLLWEGEGWDE